MKNSVTILFEGDSLTANKLDKVDASLGNGYAFKVVNKLSKNYPNIIINGFNEAVFGSNTNHVLERIEKELEQYKPDFVSLFIGVNDSRLDITFDQFKSNYESICEKIKKHNCKLLIIEPYLCPVDEYSRFESRPRLIQMQEIIKSMVLKYADAFLPLDGLFYNTYLRNDPTSYFVDGLHLSDKGTDFIANSSVSLYESILKEIIE